MSENGINKELIRARFRIYSEDYRPIRWPIKHPYWYTGSSGDNKYAILVAYEDNLKELKRRWPDAKNISYEKVDNYEFSDRFPKPDWIN